MDTEASALQGPEGPGASSPWKEGPGQTGSATSPTKPDPRSGKRNKPTLNCSECVKRKTKCDRDRPSCFSCIRRQTTCKYTALADILVSTNPSRTQKRRRKPTPVAEPEPLAEGSATSSVSPSSPPLDSPFSDPSTQCSTFTQLPRSPDLRSFVLPMASMASHPSHRRWSSSNDPSALFNLSGMNAKHPFHNYWTDAGGLAEVISVLPSKEYADALVATFFAESDPLYPVVSRHEFMIEYDRFWTLPLEEKSLFDPAHLALQFIMYATGVLHAETYPTETRASTADFYLSCCHQSLCISSYLNNCSLLTMQSMILICNFLIATNRVSGAWTFSGITQRQAYALGLNRNPEYLSPNDSFWDNHMRCRLWQAIMLQDTSLSLFLGLPPAAMHYELQAACLQLPEELAQVEFIDCRQSIPKSHTMIPPSENAAATDVCFLRAMWQYAEFAQTHLCVPKALNRPITADAIHKLQLISRFKDMYLNFSEPFNSYDPLRFEQKSRRLALQLISVSSNYFFALTVLHMEENEAMGVTCDVYGALDASHEAMVSFFALARLYPDQLSARGAASTRAYTQATMIGKILAAQKRQTDPSRRDARLMLAQSDFERYVDILGRAQDSADFETLRQKRFSELKALRNTIMAV